MLERNKLSVRRLVTLVMAGVGLAHMNRHACVCASGASGMVHHQYVCNYQSMCVRVIAQVPCKTCLLFSPINWLSDRPT